MAVVLIGTNDFGAVDMCSGTDTDLMEAVPGANRRYVSNDKRGRSTLWPRSIAQAVSEVYSAPGTGQGRRARQVFNL